MKSLLLNNLADIAAYGLVGIGVLIPRLSRRRRGHTGPPAGPALARWQSERGDPDDGFLVSVGVVYAASARAGLMTEYLWQGLLFALLYSIVAIALMCFSYVLIDWLTPGRLGELLLSGNSAVVWVNVVVFVTLGVSVGATL